MPIRQLDGEAEGQILQLVWNAKWIYLKCIERCAVARLELGEFEGKGKGLRRGVPVHRLEETPHSLLDSGGPGDQQRTRAGFDIHELQKEKGESGKVVAMQVADQYPVDIPGWNPVAFQGGESRGPAVEQHRGFLRLDEVSRLMPSRAAEGITGAEEGDPYRTHLASIPSSEFASTP
jgi:hypothetical protein